MSNKIIYQGQSKEVCHNNDYYNLYDSAAEIFDIPYDEEEQDYSLYFMIYYMDKEGDLVSVSC